MQRRKRVNKYIIIVTVGLALCLLIVGIVRVIVLEACLFEPLF